jgi:hypothetical protein
VQLSMSRRELGVRFKSFKILVCHKIIFILQLSLFMVAWGVVTIKMTDGLSLVETENIYENKQLADQHNYGSSRKSSA